MKGKYTKKKKKTGFHGIVLVVVLVLAGIAALWIAALSQEEDTLPLPETTQPPETQVTQSSAEQTTLATELPETTVPAETDEPVRVEESIPAMDLGHGVYVEQVKNYTGTYMEDGSDEIVSNVMMILVTNTGDSDVQLMNIELNYPGETCYFKLTNLPAGASAVLLEQNRAPMPEGNPVSAVAVNTALFQTAMNADFSVYEISGASGALNVKNISGQDISGNIYVYYKYKTQDLFYGGITFRVEIKDGLKSGEIRQIMTSHYNPDTCEIVMIEAVQHNGN